MKTTQMMMQSLNERKKVYDEKRRIKQRRFSIIATVAAAVILITSIPVASVLIANRAGQPTDVPESTLAMTTEDTPDIIIGNEEFFVDFCASEQANTDGEPVFYGQTEIYLDITDERAKESEGGYLRGVKAMCVVSPSSEFDTYQADIVFTDGDVELYHFTYKNKHDNTAVIKSFDFDLYIPDELEYGELHFYLNFLDRGVETIDDFASEPYGVCCLNFAKKYEQLAVSYGQETPEESRGVLIAGLNANMRESIYWIVYNLYGINENLEYEKVNNTEKYEENLKLKKFYEKALLSYRTENEEEYASIIQEFIERSPKVYDKDGNLDHNIPRHDPLDDIGKYTSSAEQIDFKTVNRLEEYNKNNSVLFP